MRKMTTRNTNRKESSKLTNLVLSSIDRVGNGFGYGYTFDPNRYIYRIVRVELGPNDEILSTNSSFYTKEEYPEERDAAACIRWLVADERASERKPSR